METEKFVFDRQQQSVIDADRGYHLVLAPPGCGKTQILTQRVINARRKGFRYEDMLCLTFTNRASRGMLQRIKESSPEGTSGLFIGNIHRYCSHYLFNNNLLPHGSIIMDEVDTAAVIMTLCSKDQDGFDDITYAYLGYANKNKPAEKGSTQWVAAQNDIINQILQIQHVIKQEMLGFPDELINRREFEQASEVLWFCHEKGVEYMKFKEENQLMDFEDLLIYSYQNLKQATEKSKDIKRYKWIQIDEVQDLNPLQLAIVDLITDKNTPVVLYL